MKEAAADYGNSFRPLLEGILRTAKSTPESDLPQGFQRYTH